MQTEKKKTHVTSIQYPSVFFQCITLQFSAKLSWMNLQIWTSRIRIRDPFFADPVVKKYLQQIWKHPVAQYHPVVTFQPLEFITLLFGAELTLVWTWFACFFYRKLFWFWWSILIVSVKSSVSLYEVSLTHTIHGTGIFTYIWLIFMVNVAKYTIHGCYCMGYNKFYKLWVAIFWSFLQTAACTRNSLTWKKKQSELGSPA